MFCNKYSKGFYKNYNYKTSTKHTSKININETF
jgi:hypothetical protein